MDVFYSIAIEVKNTLFYSVLPTLAYFKHEYLRSRAYKCLSLSSSSSLSDRFSNYSSIEILVLISWIPASKNFTFWKNNFLPFVESTSSSNFFAILRTLCSIRGLGIRRPHGKTFRGPSDLRPWNKEIWIRL